MQTLWVCCTRQKIECFRYLKKGGFSSAGLTLSFQSTQYSQPFNNKPTPTFDAILDSGADEITIPKNLADLLGCKLTKRSGKINTAGGVINAYKTKGKFNIGRGGRDVKYSNVDICVIDHDIPVLVGIKPIFDNYKVKISAFENKCVLNPVQYKLSNEAIKQSEAARKRMDKGHYYTEEEAKKILGLG